MLFVFLSFITLPLYLVIFLTLVAYGVAYAIGWLSIPVSSLSPIAPNVSAGNPIVRVREMNSRAFMIGLNAAANVIFLLPLLNLPIFSPVALIFLGAWIFIVVSLASVISVSTNRVYQGVLGWTGWISPTTIPLNIVGLFMFAWNLIPALITGGMGALRFDFTTGAVETTGGITSIFTVPSAGGFTCGHFTFLLPPPGVPVTAVQGSFIPAVPFTPIGTPNISAHETGHTLGYSAFGAPRILCAIVDQLILGNLGTALTELSADSHVPHGARWQVRLWS